MTYAASGQFQSGFWDAEILDMLLPRFREADLLQEFPSSFQDADLVRQLNFIPGLKELVMLRQVHALEHATVWVLGGLALGLGDRAFAVEMPNPELLGGMSTEHGFYLYGEVSYQALSNAVPVALRRITSGEWDLAVHPRCGTNLSVGVMLAAGLALGATILMPRAPIEQLMGLGIAAATAAYLTPEIGSLAQRYLTTAIPFNLAIANITATRDPLGRSAHFVEVCWVE
jgi:hypothetical protein